MKSTHFLLATLLLLQGFAQAQAQGGPRGPGWDEERIESLRVAFLTQELDLSPDEAASFWPLYRQYQEKRQALQPQWAAEDLKSLSDEALVARVQQQFDAMDQVSRLNREYLKTFSTVLPERKAALVFALEHGFRARIMEAMRERAGSGEPGQRPRPGVGPGGGR
jgi:hypothetical protein